MRASARSIWLSSRASSSANCVEISSLPESKATSALSPVSALNFRRSASSPASALRMAARRVSRVLCKRNRASRRAIGHHLSTGVFSSVAVPVFSGQHSSLLLVDVSFAELKPEHETLVTRLDAKKVPEFQRKKPNSPYTPESLLSQSLPAA